MASVLAGAVNAVAGGGTLLTFPTLMWVLGGHVHPEAAVLANTTSTTALLPGSLGGMWGYRREFHGTQVWLWRLFPPSIIGGFLGAVLLVYLPATSFRRLVPWLILLATLLFFLQPAISRWLGLGEPHQQPRSSHVVLLIIYQFLVSVYGGYFGAGIGILMLSSLALTGLSSIHQMNALKTLFAATINALAVLVFIGRGQIAWLYVFPMALSSVIGGIIGAASARRLPKIWVRYLITAIGFSLTVYYFWRYGA